MEERWKCWQSPHANDNSEGACSIPWGTVDLGYSCGCLFWGELLSSSLLFPCKSPATSFAMEAAFLLLQRNGRGIFHTKDLVHRLTCSYIAVRKPSLAVKRACIFMFTPIWTLGWICLDCACQ
jgi:hypothetical protein